jgi:CRISPR associated protein Cas1
MATIQQSALCTKATTARLNSFFDLMERERPKVDRSVLDFVKRTVFDPADFTIRSDGVVRLNPQLARHVANLTTRALSFN